MYKVLIVEDDPMVAMINEQYVCKNKDFSVVKSCRNGQEAIDFLSGAATQVPPASPAPAPQAASELQVAPAPQDASATQVAPVPQVAPAPQDASEPQVPLNSSSSPVDLIIMDVFMPYMDGVETLKKIRQLKIDSEVIMVTAANDSATLEETMHLGVLDFLIKPFAYERFQVALEKFAAKAQAMKSSPSVIDQSYIDSLISASPNTSLASPASAAELPKGIQQKTLDLISAYLKNNPGWVSGDKIAEEVGLSLVTIRHYMAYLVEEKKARADINYSTGGRPSMLYSSL